MSKDWRLNFLYPMELAGINGNDYSNSITEKEEEMEGKNQDNNADDEIPKRSRSKRIGSKNAQRMTQLQLCKTKTIYLVLGVPLNVQRFANIKEHY